MTIIALIGLALVTPAADSARIDEILDTADGVVVEAIDEWFQHGEWSRALHATRYRAFQFPHDYDVVTDYGFLLENMERADQALALYRKFHHDNPLDKDAWLPEITFHFIRKNYAEVIRITEPRLALKPHPNHYRMLGQSYEKLDKLDDAIRIFEIFKKDFPNDPTADANLNRVKKLKEKASR